MRKLLPLLVVVLLAGCLGGLTPDSSIDEGPPDADWSDGDGVDATALATNHFETLRAEGNFATSHRDVVSVEGDAEPDGYYPPSENYHEIDLDASRYSGKYVTPGEKKSEHFATPDVTATRRKPCTSDDCEYEYDHWQRQDGAPERTVKRINRYRTEEVVENLVRVLDSHNFTHSGIVERDGEQLHRYTAEREFEHPLPITSEPPQVTATLLVTDDGVVREYDVRYDGSTTVTVDGEEQTVDVTQTFGRTYTAVGETTVERPAWVDEAESAGTPTPTTEAEATE